MFEKSFDLSCADRNQSISQFEALIKYVIIIYQRHSSLLSCHKQSYFNKKILNLCSHEEVPIDLRSNCGILTILLIRKEFSSVEMLTNEIISNVGCFENTNSYGKLVLFHGLLCTYPIKEIFYVDDSKGICMQILNELLIYLKDSCHHILILSSRIINHILNKLIEMTKFKDSVDWSKYQFSSNFSSRLLNRLYLLWDHYLDIVKHLIRETFSSFIKFQLLIDNCARAKMQLMAVSMFEEKPLKKCALSILVHLIPGICVTEFLKCVKNSPKILAEGLNDPALATRAGNLIQALFEKHAKEVDFDLWIDIWLSPLMKNYDQKMLTYGYERLLFKFFSCKPESITTAIGMLSKSPILANNDQHLLIMCAKIKVNFKNLKGKTCLDGDNVTLWKDTIPINIVRDILLTEDDCSRILAFNLICESSKTTELFSDNELKLILMFLSNNLANQMADFRQKVVNNCKRLLHRVCAGIKAKNKVMKLKNSDSELRKLVLKYETFINQLFTLMVENISLDNSFPRRTTAFHILETMFDSVLEKLNYFHYLEPSLCSPAYTETLIINLIDSFEVNKIIIVKLLKISLHHYVPKDEFVQVVINDAWKLASSFKPPETLISCFVMSSIAKIDQLMSTSDQLNSIDSKVLTLCHQILDRLKVELLVAKKSILDAAANSPMYGLLVVLRMMISNVSNADITSYTTMWNKLVTDIIDTCSCVVKVVEPVVNNDSPEGFLPMDFCRQNVGTVRKILKNALAVKSFDDFDSFTQLSEEDLVKGQAVTSQILLLCGWRSIKESCLLLGQIVKLMKIAPINSSVLSIDQIRTIGKLILHLMINTKHRGAFEQANVAFNDICNILWCSKDEVIAKMPEVWLLETLDILIDYKNPRLCATRRSAGLPFIIQSILATEPDTRADKSVKETMKFLFEFANDCDLERRVHSMNIMRALFRETRLSESVISYASDGVQLALQSSKSKSWSERNSATLMLASIINKIVGIKKSRDSIRCKSSVSSVVFFTNFPSLCDVFLNELSECYDEMKRGKITVSTYPVLLILSRLGQANFEGKFSGILCKFAFLIIKCCFSPSYHLRLLSSRALIPFVTPANKSKIMDELFSCISLSNQNQLHGVLLCLKEISFYHSTLELADHLEQFYQILQAVEPINKCLVTRSSGLELCLLMIKKRLLTNEICIDKIIKCCYSIIKNINIEEKRHIPEIFNIIKTSASLIWHVEPVNFVQFVLKLPNEEITEVCFEAFEWVSMPRNLFSIIYPKLYNCQSVSLRSNIYSILVKILINMDYSNTICTVDAAIKLYFICQDDISNSYREKLISSVIVLMGHLLRYIIEEEINKSDMFYQYLNDISKYSDSEYSSVVRLSLVNSLTIVCSIWRDNAPEQSCIYFVELLIDLLLADESEVQSSAGVATATFLNKPRNCRLMGHNIHPKEDLIRSLMDYLGTFSTPASFAMMLHIALKEDEVEEFGLSEDRAFEKGETNLYREQTRLAHICTKSLSLSLTKCSNILIRSNCLEDLVCSKEENSSDDAISIQKYAEKLRLDIEFILNKMQRLKSSTPLTFPNFSLWCTRLASRSVLYAALKSANIPVEPVSDDYLDSIKRSVLKPILFNDILKLLV